MDEEREAHWERVHRTRAPDSVSWYQEVPEGSLALIEESGVARDERLLDVGGGLSNLVDHLLDRGFSQVSVLDISGGALEHSQGRLGERAAQVRWIVSDVLAFDAEAQLGGQVGLWHDRAVFHFLITPAARERYREVLLASLRPGGFAIVATFADDGPERCSGLPVARYSPEELDRELGPELLLVSSRRLLHRTPSGGEQRFVFTLFRRAA